MDKAKLVDEQRRNAITDWWGRTTLRDFIATKRAAIRGRAEAGQ